MGFHTHEFTPHPCSWDESPDSSKRTMGLAQLSNRLLLFPDGHSFDEEGMIGISYARTPFGKINATDTRNFWTLIFDSENYAGPVAYFLPEFWKLRPKGDEEDEKDFKDFSNTPEIQMSSPAWECHAMPNYVDGNTHKLIKMSVPRREGRTVLWMGQRAHPDSELMDPLEKALSTGRLDPSQLLKDGTTRPSCRSHGDAKFGSVATWASYNNVVENGDCLCTLDVKNSSCPRNGNCDVPQYYSSGQHVDPSQASAALRKARFPTQPFPTNDAYDALSQAPKGGCRDSPGPADSKLYCAKTIDDTWVGYRWYRFVDQPGLQQARLSNAERNFMQRRVETLHKMVPTPVSKWINGRNVEAEGLARMDPAAIATPPSGLEHGYVPIVLYQGYKKPAACHTGPVGSASVTLFEEGGSGKLTILASQFTANTKSDRGGALAWDACGGGVFDNGHPIWQSGSGTRIGRFQVNGDWNIRIAGGCGKTWDYPGMSVSRAYSKADGSISLPGLNYFEVASTNVEFV